MIGLNTVSSASSVSAAGSRGLMASISENTLGSIKPIGKVVIETQKSSGQDIKADANHEPHGTLEKIRDDLHEFTDGILRPKSGLVGEKTYKTSFSQAMENLKKEHIGALTGFHNRVNGFAFGIMRPETGIIGEKTYDSSNSMTLENLSIEYIGAVAGIKDVIHKYAEAAIEKIGPPVKLVESAKILNIESENTLTVNVARDI